MKTNFQNLPVSSFFKNMSDSFRSLSETTRVATIFTGIAISLVPLSKYLNMVAKKQLENAQKATLNLDEFETKLLKETEEIKTSIKKIENEDLQISNASFKKNVGKILKFFDQLPEQIQVNCLSQKSLLRINVIRLHLSEFRQNDKQAITDTLNNSFMELIVNYSKNYNQNFAEAASLEGLKSQHVISEPSSPLSTLSPIKITNDLIAGAGNLRDRIFGSNKNPKFFKPQISQGHDEPFLRIARLNFKEKANSARAKFLGTENKQQYYGLINYVNWVLNSHEEQTTLPFLQNELSLKIKSSSFKEIYTKLRLLMPKERMLGDAIHPNIQDLFMVFNNIGQMTDSLHTLENELINDPESPSASESEVGSEDTIESMNSTNLIKFIKHVNRWLRKNCSISNISGEECLDDLDVAISFPNTTKSVEASQYLAKKLSEMFDANETNTPKFTAYLAMYCKNVIYLTKTLQDRLMDAEASIINEQDASTIKSAFESCKNYFKTRYYLGEERAQKFINAQMFSQEMSIALQNAYGNFEQSEDYSLDVTLVTPPKAKKQLFTEKLDEQKKQQPTKELCAIQ